MPIPVRRHEKTGKSILAMTREKTAEEKALIQQAKEVRLKVNRQLQSDKIEVANIF